MTAATSTRPVRKVLREYVERFAFEEHLPAGAAGQRVDRDKGILFGVKILGTSSSNGRKYLPEAIRSAVPLYEGASVRLNHPKQPTDNRDAHDVFGWLREVHVGEDDCLYGNLHYLKSHPFAERICEAAEKNPRLYGLSHNSEGEGEDDRDGVFVVRAIVEVRSVDLVADPATTKGLFEQREPKQRRPMKLKAFFESVAAKWASHSKRSSWASKQLLEMGDLEADADLLTIPTDDAPAEPAAANPEEALWQGFRTALMAVIDDSTTDAAGKLAKIGDMLRADEKLKGSGEDAIEAKDDEVKDKDADKDLEESCDDGKDAKDKGKMKEQRDMQRKLRQLEARDAVRDLCEAAGVVPTKPLLKALVALDDAADRQALLDEHQQHQRGTLPRTQKPGGQALTEGVDRNGVPQTTEGLLAFLQN